MEELHLFHYGRILHVCVCVHVHKFSFEIVYATTIYCWLEDPKLERDLILCK